MAKGWFVKGHDPRRHQLTRQERRKGYRNAQRSVADDWDKAAWLFRHIRGFYRAKARAEADAPL